METPPHSESPSQKDAPGESHVPAVSVVLPVYNGERFLAEALDSILAQTFTDFELIAVDDCSTDGTANVLAEYAARDSRIKVLTNRANSKLPASLNNGFAIARGRWFTWTSDDNLLLPGMLEELAAAMVQHPHVDIVHADFWMIDENGARTGHIASGRAEEMLIDNQIGCCFLYRREVDQRLGGYDETLFGMEDYDFWLRAHAAGLRYLHLERDLYLYRRHGGSLTNQRARSIQRMVHDRLAKDVSKLPASPFRARARVRLMTRDPFTLRPGYIVSALRDSPRTLVEQLPAIAAWVRHSAVLRLRPLLSRVAR